MYYVLLENNIFQLIFRTISKLSRTGSNNGHESLKQRRPSRAYLLRQKATGEETVVTLVPIQGNFRALYEIKTT